MATATGGTRRPERKELPTVAWLKGPQRGLAISGERMGIPGQPFPEDVARRDQSREAAARYPAGSPVQRFYDELRKETESSIKDQLASDEELVG